MTLYSTSIKDVFIAEKENFTGLFMKKENMWYFEYYLNGQLISEKVEVAF
jgi:hypothetical protein